MDKESILAEIKRTGSENGGIGLGRIKFARITGIKNRAWLGKYWRTWGDALREAGFGENTLSVAYDKTYLVARLAQLTQVLGRFPAHADLMMARKKDATFPSHTVFERCLGPRSEKLTFLRQHAIDNGLADILVLLPQVEGKTVEDPDEVGRENRIKNGFVYLGMLKIDTKKRYKIGRTNLVERRSAELSLQLPEKLQLVHYITTDDMAGIESYWHKRFEDKRTNGEWFELSANDVKAFKSRRTM
jgi:hypothetical protein